MENNATVNSKDIELEINVTVPFRAFTALVNDNNTYYKHEVGTTVYDVPASKFVKIKEILSTCNSRNDIEECRYLKNGNLITKEEYEEAKKLSKSTEENA